MSAGALPAHVDVLVVGAGISGIGAAVHLQEQCPGKSLLVLEAMDQFGGTWHTHRYPGVRSDSDLFTFGYRFKPWTGAPIADGHEILRYLDEVIEEHGLRSRIRYRHRVVAADWSAARRCWLITLEHTAGDGGTTRWTLTAGFLWMCQGYYRHAGGYTPAWPGIERFQGRLVHPQTWPGDLELEGKRMLVIGSGATAATLVPAVAGRCAHVTMLQRSPTYFITGRNANELADTLRELDIRPDWIHEIVRRKVLHDQAAFTRRCSEQPEAVKTELLAAARAALGPELGHTVDTNFTPRYRPWQQRVAFIPDADLFKAIRTGQASVVTDEIETFTQEGVRLKSGQELAADIVVTATGFELNVLGDIAFTIDGTPMRFADSVTYRGAMFTGIPNMAWVFGYFRASWTLRVDLLGDFVCRLLKHMDAKGAQVVVPTLRPQDAGMPLQPWVATENFNPGYLARGMDHLPRQGSHAPWLHRQDYWQDQDELPVADLDDEALVYG